MSERSTSDRGRVSKSAVRKAGSRLRESYLNIENGGLASPDYEEAQIKIIRQYRAQFSPPLNSMSASLRSYLASSAISGEVTQRLKRMPTIIDKLLNREHRLDLSRMRDIGGCRVVIEPNSLEVLYKFADYVASRNRECKVIDYVSQPRSSGYRGIHLEIMRHGLPIEVQLRTPLMHSWAETVEAFSDVLGQNYKQDGDTIVHKYMRLMLQLDILQERGESPTAEFMEQVALLAGEISDSLVQTDEG